MYQHNQTPINYLSLSHTHTHAHAHTHTHTHTHTQTQTHTNTHKHTERDSDVYSIAAFRKNATIINTKRAQLHIAHDPKHISFSCISQNHSSVIMLINCV